MRVQTGLSSIPPIQADTPSLFWAIDFEFVHRGWPNDKAIKIASVFDEHTRESLLNLVERSIVDRHRRCR
ncbi:hypothetical protein NGTWS0302_05400 [Mycolicibacterium cyprinidarum]|uniref:Uncharacterized protein n=1 Tax=Mycolicibacterium cyprinidarum TaxID=2860311 RepID=A0ABQ4VBW2_9MYCO|nr:hypothetical protein NGTWS0302_05400 [Mycolicibacterium sp. NGTWS0302]GJF17830.1 hypothetical protein NGTWS1702_24850 [Mycolicibacterium sp. NGTWSNA01]